MSFITETFAAPARTSIWSQVTARLWGWLERTMQAQSRADVIARLETCSDAELASMGITRSGIIQHVYRDIYFL